MGIGPTPPDCRFMELPCGRCIGCKLDRARSWAIRITHEAQLYDSNLFLTLTYSEQCIPRNFSLEYADFSGFMKRLRRRLSGVTRLPDGRLPIRFFCCGEYGGQTKRPHYHAILFNARFPDMVGLANGTFRSNLCEELWQKGNVVIGSVNGRSAAYVAGYTLKKVHGRAAAEHYEDVVDIGTGELISRRPEFVVMSRRPGIGAGWYEKFGSDVFPGDKAVHDGKVHKVPRYYFEKFKRVGDAGVVESILEERYRRASEKPEESTPERRAVREEVALRRSEMFGGRGL